MDKQEIKLMKNTIWVPPLSCANSQTVKLAFSKIVYSGVFNQSKQIGKPPQL